MKKHRLNKMIKILILSIFIGFGITYCFFVNAKYPSYNTIKYNCDESFTFNNLDIKFNSFKIYQKEEFAKEFPTVNLYDSDQINMILSMIVENHNDTPKIIPCDQFFFRVYGVVFKYLC